jgi:cytochrome c oxidase subunit IV
MLTGNRRLWYITLYGRLKMEPFRPIGNQNREVATAEPQAEKARVQSFRNSLLATMGEYLFILLPLVVLAFVLLMTDNKHHNLLTTPEWSFGAAILFGQAVQRIAAAASRTQAYRWEKTTLLVSALLVLGLVPSLLTLALVIHLDHCTRALAYSQILLFSIGSLAFLLFGAASHYLLFRE